MVNQKREPYVFFLLCLISILPVLFSRYYVTLDGPTHLYNANLIKNLCFNKDVEITKLFQINSMAVPNWMGHFIMAFLRIFLPAFLSEKVLLLMYFILTPLFFRKFILLFVPSNKIFTYLMLLFTHNTLFYFGSFNMMLGVMFLFITLYYYKKYCAKINFVKALVLTLLLLMAYFSHFMIYSITLCFLAVLSFYISDATSNNNSGKKILKRLMFLCLCALPSVILAARYFITVDSVEEGAPRLPLKELTNWIVNVSPLLTLSDKNPWKIYTNILFILFVIIIVCQIVGAVKKYFSTNGVKLKLKIPAFGLVCLFSSFVFLVLYFVLPNAIVLTYRLIFLFYIFFIMWIALVDHPKWLHFLSLIIIVFVQLMFTVMYIKEMRSLSKQAIMFEEVAGKIEEGNTVLTLNYSDNWLHQHISGYIGGNKSLAVLENYEAAQKWFPVQWNKKNYNLDELDIWGIENKRIACSFYINENDTSCFSLTDYSQKIYPIDYVVKFGNNFDLNDSCNIKVNRILHYYYTEIMSNELCVLYLKK